MKKKLASIFVKPITENNKNKIPFFLKNGSCINFFLCNLFFLAKGLAFEQILQDKLTQISFKKQKRSGNATASFPGGGKMRDPGNEVGNAGDNILVFCVNVLVVCPPYKVNSCLADTFGIKDTPTIFTDSS